MTQQDLLLIHGTWGNGDNWGDFGTELEARGFRVHRPTAPFHGHPRKVDIWSSAQKMAGLGLLDYVSDLVALVETMETPPIIVGHSVGALLAQLVAARVPNRGVILLGTAPAAGVAFLPYEPKPLLLWGRYIPQWLGGKPMYPVSKTIWDKYICNTLPRELGDPFYDTLCAESGTLYRQMIFWFLDPTRAAKVDYAAVGAPVLVIAGAEDHCTRPRLSRVTAKKFGAKATYVEIPDSDHMMVAGPALPKTLAAIDDWLAANELAGAATSWTSRHPARPQ